MLLSPVLIHLLQRRGIKIDATNQRDRCFAFAAFPPCLRLHLVFHIHWRLISRPHRIFLSFFDDFELGGEFAVAVNVDIVDLEHLDDPEPDLSHSAVTQKLILNLPELTRSMLEHALNQILALLKTPVAAFFGIKVLEVETTILEVEVIISPLYKLPDTFAHLNYIPHFLFI